MKIALVMTVLWRIYAPPTDHPFRSYGQITIILTSSSSVPSNVWRCNSSSARCDSSDGQGGHPTPSNNVEKPHQSYHHRNHNHCNYRSQASGESDKNQRLLQRNDWSQSGFFINLLPAIQLSLIFTCCRAAVVIDEKRVGFEEEKIVCLDLL